jgi:hypothetical protein
MSPHLHVAAALAGLLLTVVPCPMSHPARLWHGARWPQALVWRRCLVARQVGHDGGMSRQPVGYAARPYAVVAALTDLSGPTSGTVCLPRRLDWGPTRTFDLDDAGDTAVMYETVLRESRRVEDLRAYLDAATLRSLWRALILPAPLRALWEARFPELRSAAAA